MIISIRTFAVLILACLVRSGFACTCHENNRYSAQNLVFSSVVFEGRIVSTRSVHAEKYQGIKALFKIERWLSPKSGADTISVYTPDVCDIGFSADQSWLILANPEQGFLSTTYCDRSVLKDKSRESEQQVKFFRDLTIGNHKIDIELKIWSGSYRLIGRIEDGEPTGAWVKLRGVDSLAVYNFRDGRMVGMQMETDEETTPPERHYFELTKTGQDSTLLVIYDNRMKPGFRCVLRDGPYRVRYQSPYWDAARFHLLNYFTSSDCQNLSGDDR